MDDSEAGRASTHTTSHMSGRMTTRIEVVGRVSGRRRWTVEQKLAILRDAFGPEGSVRAACDRHEVGSGSIYTWRRQAMSGDLAGVTRRLRRDARLRGLSRSHRQSQTSRTRGRHRVAPGLLRQSLRSRRNR